MPFDNVEPSAQQVAEARNAYLVQLSALRQRLHLHIWARSVEVFTDEQLTALEWAIAELAALQQQRDSFRDQLAAVDAQLGFPDGDGHGRIELLQQQIISREDREKALKLAELGGFAARADHVLEARRLLRLEDGQS